MKEEDQYLQQEESEKRRNSLNGWLKDVEPLIQTLNSKTIKKEQEIRDSMTDFFNKAHEVLYEIEDKKLAEIDKILKTAIGRSININDQSVQGK